MPENQIPSETPRPAAPGRRRAAVPEQRAGAAALLGRMRDPVAWVGALLVLAVVGVVALVDDSTPVPGAAAPDRVQRHASTLVCPPGVKDAETRWGRAASDAAGEPAEVTTPGGESPQQVAPGRVGEVSGDVLVSRGDAAVGAAATRWNGTSAAPCTEPAAERWFTGVGAGAEHRSVLHLVNPDSGTAVVDVTVLGPTGPVDVPALRGVSVAAHDTLSFDLAEVAPNRDELTLGVLVSRGRVGASVLDRYADVEDNRTLSTWLAPQSGPASTSTLLGLPGADARTLTVANPGQDEARVRLEVVTAESTFEPKDFTEVAVPPGTVESIDVSRVLGARTVNGASGVVVVATRPVLAGLGSRTARTWTRSVAPVAGERLGGVVPTGMRQLVLLGEGEVTVRSRTSTGRDLPEQSVTLQGGHDTRVELARNAAWIEVVSASAGTGDPAGPEQATPGAEPGAESGAAEEPWTTGTPGVLAGALRGTGNDARILPLAPLLFDDLVPQVRPALR